MLSKDQNYRSKLMSVPSLVITTKLIGSSAGFVTGDMASPEEVVASLTSVTLLTVRAGVGSDDGAASVSSVGRGRLASGSTDMLLAHKS